MSASEYNFGTFVTHDYMGLRQSWHKVYQLKTVIFAAALAFLLVMFIYRRMDRVGYIFWFVFTVFVYMIVMMNNTPSAPGLIDPLKPFPPHLGRDGISPEVEYAGTPQQH